MLVFTSAITSGNKKKLLMFLFENEVQPLPKI